MANGDGGDIVYGIEEEQGKPYASKGIEERM
jgi:hypothetical protein